MLSRQSLVSLYQLLDSLGRDSVQLLLFKHLGILVDYNESSMLEVVASLRHSKEDELFGLIEEVTSELYSLRLKAPIRRAVDQRLADFLKWLEYDGWIVADTKLVRLSPEVEAVAEIQDLFTDLLVQSGLDPDREILRRMQGAAEYFRSEPPDYNASGSSSRIMFETLVRRLALSVARKYRVEPPDDAWGHALRFLREQRLIDEKAENAFAKTYTWISPAAHTPISLDQEEWTRIVRTYCLSACYFLLKTHQAMNAFPQ